METKPVTELTEKELEQLLEQKRQEKKKALAREKKQYAEDKEKFLKDTCDKFEFFHEEMKLLKKEVIQEANEIYERMYKIEGKDPKENKSLSLKNAADNIKVTVERQERFEFNDEAIVHINAIKDLFKDKYANRNKKLYGYLDELLIKGKTGEYDPKLIVKIRRRANEDNDEEMLDLINKLADCQKVTGSALYCRLHLRDGNGKWQDVSLQFSSL